MVVLETNNIEAIKQLYRNNEFQTYVISADIALKIIDQVVASNFDNHFFLNLFECLRAVEKDKLLKPNKNFEKVLQNIHELEELNKLKFFWKVYSAVENGPEYVNYNVVNHELTKVTFDEVDKVHCEKTLRNIYSSVLGKDAMKKLINFSL